MNIGSFLSIALHDEQELLPLPTDECYSVLKNGILAFAKVEEAYKQKKWWCKHNNNGNNTQRETE